MQRDLAAAGRIDFKRFSNATVQVQTIQSRVLIEHHGNGIRWASPTRRIARLGVQEQPRILLFNIVGRRRRGPSKSAALDEFRRNPQNPRLPWLI